VTEHLDSDALVAWWLGERGDDVEDHLFECARCAHWLDDLVQIADGVRDRGRAGLATAVCPPALVAKLARDGVQVSTFTLHPGELVPCQVALGDQLMIARLVGDFSGAKQLDVLVEIPDAPPERLVDLPVNPAHGEINLADPAEVVRGYGDLRMQFTVLDVRDDGERVLGRYTLVHHA
jgi:hypothetical protein